jgi:radical SAM protein with 4Fe4S-binding SPASM domain
MKDMGLLISINTNGSLLSGEIRQRLLENPPFRINVSLYGGSQETYGVMCGNQAFDQVVENIRVLKENGVDVRLNVSITPYNQKDLEQIYRISREFGVVVKASAYMYPPIRVHNNCGHRLSAEDAAGQMVRWDALRLAPDAFDQLALDMKNKVSVDSDACTMDLDEGVSCRAGSTSFWMTWDGKMMPCGMMPDPVVYPFEVGFKEAWQQLRSKTKEIRMPTKCVSCKNRTMCQICAAMCVSEIGGYEQAPEYVCRMTEERIRRTLKIYEERNG